MTKMSVTKLSSMLFFAILTLAITSKSVLAVPLTYFGEDLGGATTNADNAFVNWQSDSGAYALDNLEGLAGSGGLFAPTSLTSTAGNIFTSLTDGMGSNDFTFGVLEGIHLRMFKQNDPVTVTWELPVAATSFGFFSRNNSGTIKIALEDGTVLDSRNTQTSSGGSGNNWFWGISGLDAATDTLVITSNIAGANGSTTPRYDRFVNSTPVAQVSEPGIVVMIVLGMLMIVSRKRAVVIR
jgi:hypothetical protein